MKLSYDELQSRPRILRSLTSLTVKEFEALLVSFSSAWESFVNSTFQREGRQRTYGGGRKPNLKQHEDKLLFILVYCCAHCRLDQSTNSCC
jgi:hypothetical protein